MKSHTSMTPMPYTDIVLKGFVIPPGYRLRIATKEGEITKEPGAYSGSQYSFLDVLQGNIENWTLEKFEEDIIFHTPPKLPNDAYSAIDSIRQAGGDVLLVGGVVRDVFTGQKIKDVDLEVYGLPLETLTEVLSPHGKVNTVGVSFGITKLTTADGNEYDFSLPRRESKTGDGHRGFDVEADPYMTPEESARRRDFTINALAMTPEGRVYDFFGGLSDLHNKVLRHVSDRFSEDPLRVLRAFQFVSRFDFTLAPETAELCSSLKNEYQTLPVERIWTEWEKWATKGVRPSAGLKLLADTGWVDFYPEINAMDGVGQEPEYHPEIWLLDHTMHVVDEMARISDRDGIEGDDRLVLMFAALCHDFGKPYTTITEDGRIKSPGHDKAGMTPTRTFLQRIGANEAIIERVIPLVAEHMSHLNDITPRSVRRLALRLYPANVDMLVKVIEADHSGRPPLPKELPQRAQELLDAAIELRVGEDKPQQLMQGRHLLELAMAGKIPDFYRRGGPHFGQLLKLVFDAQLEGMFETEEGGVTFVTRLFSPDFRDGLIEAAQLPLEGRKKLLEYVKANGVELEDVWERGIDFLREITG